MTKNMEQGIRIGKMHFSDDRAGILLTVSWKKERIDIIFSFAAYMSFLKLALIVGVHAVWAEIKRIIS